MLYGYFDKLYGFFGGAITQVWIVRKCISKKVSLERMVIFDPDEESSKGDRIGMEFNGEKISQGNTQKQENWFNNSVWLDIMR